MIVTSLLIYFASQWIHFGGPNYPIDLYGRVVNEKGVGIQGVAVEFQLIYFESAPAPTIFPQNEKTRVVTVFTGADGDFHVGPVFGRAIDPQRFSKGGKDLVADSTKRQPYMGVNMSERTSRLSAPDTPAKRVTFVFKDPSP